MSTAALFVALPTAQISGQVLWHFRVPLLAIAVAAVTRLVSVVAPQRLRAYFAARKVRKAKRAYRGNHGAKSRADRKLCRAALQAALAKQDAMQQALTVKAEKAQTERELVAA